MTIQVFGAEATVSYLNRAFSDTSPSNAIFANQVANAKSMGDAAFANAFGASFSGLSNADLSKKVLTNIGVLPTTDTSVAALEQALTDYFAAFGSKTTGTNGQVTADTRGFIVLQLATILAGLENATGNQAVYAAAATAWNNEITASYTYSSNTANTTSGQSGASNIGQTFTLTTATDTFAGTTGNDTFNALTTTSGDTFTAFDALDGGAGVDTLNAAITTPATAAAVPGGLSVKNIENVVLNVTGTGAFVVDPSIFAGVTSITATSSGGKMDIGTSSSNASGTIAITAASAADTVKVYGGSSATVTAPIDKAVTVSGAALTAVSVKGGAASTIDNATKSTLTSVTLDTLGGAMGITGDAVNNVTWKNQTVDATVTLKNAVSTAVTLNVDGIGYKADGTSAAADKLTFDTADVKLASLTINATGTKSSVALDIPAAVSALKTINVTGSAPLKLASGFVATTPTIITKLDGSAATGAITLDTTGMTALATINTGSAADTVTLAAAAPASTAINLGAGDDKLLVTGTGALTATPGVIDGGAGTDSVSATLLAGAAGSTLVQFKNFEAIDLSAAAAGTVDVNGLQNSTIAGLTMASSAGGGVTVSGLPAGAGLTVTDQVTTASSATAGASIIKLASTAGAADAFTVTFATGTITDSTKKTSDAGTLTVDGIENFNIVSGGSADNNTVSVTDNSLQTLTITGATKLDLTIAASGTAPTSTTDTVNGVKLIDGSAATGKLTLNASALTTVSVAGVVTASTVANSGLTIKGGTNADTITGTGKADTIIGGGGADVITGGLGADKITLSGNTSTINLGGVGASPNTVHDTGSNNATITQTALLTSAFDVVTGATAGTKFTIDTTLAAKPYTSVDVLGDNKLVAATTTLATNLQGADNTVVFARGTYDAANGIFNFGAAGPDTAMTYDFDATKAATDFHTVILVGYVPSTTTAATSAVATANFATITLA